MSVELATACAVAVVLLLTYVLVDWGGEETPEPKPDTLHAANEVLREVWGGKSETQRREEVVQAHLARVRRD